MQPALNSKVVLLGVWTAIWIGLSACTVNEVAPAARLEPPSGQGTVIVSLTRSGDVNSSIWLLLNKAGSTFPVQVLLDDWNVKRDWAQLKRPGRANQLSYSAADAPVGRLAVLQLPAGEYEIFQWKGDTTVWTRGGLNYAVNSTVFSIRFTVRPGEVSYLGQLRLILPNEVGLADMKADFRIEFTRAPERDLALLKSKYPDAANVQIAVAAPPAPSELAGYYYVHPLDAGGMDTHD